MKVNKEKLEKIKEVLKNLPKAENNNLNNFKAVEKQAEKQFYESIKGFVNHPKYEEIFRCLDVVLDSKKLHSFVCDGNYGLGKSTIITSYLKQNKKQFTYINSYTTSLAFYHEVYNHKDDILIIDDLQGIWKEERGLSILRALLNTDEVRYLRYESSSEKLKAPSSFIFNGKIIILCNDIKHLLDEVVLSRAIYRKLEFTHKEKINFIKDILAFNYKLDNKQIQDIIEFIIKNVDETVISFNFRSLLKITEFYLKYPNEWKELSLKEIEKDEDMVFIKELENKSITTKAKVQEFIEKSGKSRMTYFRYLKRYKELVSK